MPKAVCKNQLVKNSNAPPITALTRKMNHHGLSWNRLSAMVINRAPKP